MRLFIAIQPDRQMKDALRAVQNELRRRGVEGNYTRAENLHLTLAFIGEYPDPDAVLEAMGKLKFEPFGLRLAGLGAFGELWWAGLEESDALDMLVRRLRRTLAESGIPFDRKAFRPHITLIRRPEYKKDPQLGSLTIAEAGMKAEHMSLMLSTRGKSGMIYTELGSVSAQRD